jgi:Toxin SymE, type I toxin-antitoxin system
VVELRRPAGVWGTEVVVVPWVRLSGRWLAEAGFAVGRRFEIAVEPGRLRLQVVADELAEG